MYMTIKDLAAKTGYSVGTVSRVLNNHPNVSDKARDTIMAIVNEVGFELNTNAKNLKQQRNKLVVAIVKGRANEMFAQLVEEIQRLIAGAEYPLLLHYIDEGEDEVRAARKLCREKKPMGVLFLGGESKNFGADFDGFKVPTVLATNSAVEWGFANLSSVTIDDTAAACCAVSYLIAQGHRSISVIGGDCEESEISRMRYRGCRQAFAQNPEAEFCHYESARFSFQGGYEAMERLLSGGNWNSTALFTMADVQAIGAIRCLCDHGFRVPEDVSVVGFDGLEIGRYYHPKLTTIRQQTEKIALECVKILLAAIDGGAAVHQIVPYELVTFESVKKL
mgnify:CR=1 FL=1